MEKSMLYSLKYLRAHYGQGLEQGESPEAMYSK